MLAAGEKQNSEEGCRDGCLEGNSVVIEVVREISKAKKSVLDFSCE